jgi:hypothetical protein
VRASPTAVASSSTKTSRGIRLPAPVERVIADADRLVRGHLSVRLDAGELSPAVSDLDTRLPGTERQILAHC